MCDYIYCFSIDFLKSVLIVTFHLCFRIEKNTIIPDATFDSTFILTGRNSFILNSKSWTGISITHNIRPAVH